MKKKIVSLLLAGALLFSNNYSALAGNIENQEVTGNTQSEVQVSLGIESTYSITIPKTIEMDKETKSAEYEISIQGSISELQYISVVPEYEFIMTDGIHEVTATVSQERTEWEASDISENGGAIAIGCVEAGDIMAGNWSGSFIYDISINDKRFAVTAVDEEGTDLNATGLHIVGTKKAELLNALVASGVITDFSEVNALIDVQTDDFTGTAQATFEVDAFAESGEIVALYHYDETDGWEYIGVSVVTEEGLITGCFDSFSPVAMILDEEHEHVDEDGDRVCDDCTGETDSHVHKYDENGNCLCGHQCAHAYTGIVTKAATCTETGTRVYSCGNCNHSYSETIPVMEHDHDEETGVCTCGDLAAGLYNINGKKLAAWDETGIDIATDYTSSNYSTNTVSPYYILKNTYPTTTKVVLPDTVTKIGNYSFNSYSALKEIVIPDGVTRIGTNAFAGCTGLTSITLPADAVINENSFKSCTKVVNITLTKGVKGIVNDYTYATYQYTPWYISSVAELNIVLEEGIKSIGRSAFNSCNGLKNITIPNSTTDIDYEAFYGCANLTAITIPVSTVTYYNTFTNDTAISHVRLTGGTSGYAIKQSFMPWDVSTAETITVIIDDDVKSIGESLFSGCTALKSIVIPDSVERIESLAFNGCTGLTSIVIPNGVKNIKDSAFSGCTGLTGIVIPDNVTTIGASAFSGCTSLADIEISDSVTTIGAFAFKDTPWLAKQKQQSTDGLVIVNNSLLDGTGVSGNVVIPDGVIKINDSAFIDCTGLTSVTIPDSVTRIGSSAFSGCTGLTEITIPDSVTGIGDSAFNGCTGLADVIIPDSVTGMGSSVFYGCTGLTAVTISDSLKSIGSSVFHGCTGLTNVTIPDGVTSIGESAFNGCTGLKDITMPDSVTSIGKAAFSGCTVLTDVTIPDGVTSIGNSAFSSCKGLTDITIPDSVISIESFAFSSCVNLANVVLSSNITKITSGLFMNCPSLTSIVIPDGVTSIDANAFNGCTSLQDVTIPESVTSLGGTVFDGTPWLESQKASGMVIIGSILVDGTTASGSITIPNNVTKICDSAFSGCTALKNVTIPSSVTSIGKSAFKGCTGLTSVTVPNSVTSIGSYAFSGCTGLSSIKLSNNLTRIETDTFEDCSSLTGIVIPEGVTEIAGWAFEGCTALVTITLPSTLKEIGMQCFYDNNFTSMTYNGTTYTAESKLQSALSSNGVSVGTRAFG